MPITPKNWQSFQHYRDRSPGWIKLHRTLLDNHDYFRLSPEAGKALPLLWLLASEKDGVIPDATEVAFRLRIADDLAADIIAELVERGFLVCSTGAAPPQRVATPAQRIAAANGFGSRQFSDATKRLIWERDGGKCRICAATESIEYDHVIPVSKGGDSSPGNGQLLCLTCNRRKRVHVAPPLQVQRSLEEERETEKEGEADSRAVAVAPPPRTPCRFEEFWQAYPRRSGANPRAPAEKKFAALVKSGVDPQMMIDAIKDLAGSEAAKGNIGTSFIPQAMTWLNQKRWADHAAVAFLLADKDDETKNEEIVKMWARTGRWSRFGGPEPGSPACRISPELFAKHGLDPQGCKIVKEPEAT